MPTPLTAAILTCAILSGDHNIPRSRAVQLAGIEAEAFLAAGELHPHVNTLTVIAVGYVESRFNPTGSQRDRDNGMWGVMQISVPELRCMHRGHDDARYCTESTRVARERMLDPAHNIEVGMRMLETAWARAHFSTPRDWVGAYFWGSVPRADTRRGRRAMRAYRMYAARVRRAEGLLRRRIEWCTNGGGE